MLQPATSSQPVWLRRSDADGAWLVDLARRAADQVRRPVSEQARYVAELATAVPLPGHGRTHERWEVLATLGATDLALARVAEPHLDALAILAECPGGPVAEAGQSWGVFAAEGPGARLEAVRDHDGDDWLLTGTKPWCSLAGTLSHALVTAWVDDERRGLFAIDLRHPGVHVLDEPWAGVGLPTIPSGPIACEAVPARAVGGPHWYLTRDGFAWGGLGVAAVWYGGAVGVARRLHARCRERTPDQIGLAHLGAVDARLAAARALLAEAADAIDAEDAFGDAGALDAARVRQVVADTVDAVLLHTAHALGPAPLATEKAHAQRVADLQLYVRQHHGERDAAALGRALLETAPSDGDRAAAPW